MSGKRLTPCPAGISPMDRRSTVVADSGGNTMKALGDGPSPFERSSNIDCPVIGFFGAQDTNPSPADT